MTATGAPRAGVDRHTPLRFLRGVGPRRAEQLAEAGLATVDDLLFLLPRRYEDRREVLSPADVPGPGSHTVRGRLHELRLIRTRRRNFAIVRARVTDERGFLAVTWFNQPYLLQRFGEGEEVVLHGKVRMSEGALLELVNPSAERAGEPRVTGRVVPVYPSAGGLGSAAVARLMDQALPVLDSDPPPERLPDELLRRYSLPPLARALVDLHRPSGEVSLELLGRGESAAHQRLVYEELLELQLELALLRAREVRAEKRHRYRIDDRARAVAREVLPFRLTAAQKRAVREIVEDLRSPHPMLRLLQGDVGSGKTIVAALAACQAIEAGWQAAFMAPTEILAEQHYLKLRAWLEPLGVKVAWLSGSLKKAAKKAMLAQAASSAQLIVGTHALIQEGVDFARLGLAIVDEQHRFGVAQRLELRRKGGNPHQLMMSATPIPRTLAMSYYADLDVSVLDELPPGRQPITTKLVSDARRDEVIARVRGAVASGRQAYWVCPLIEESETLQLQTAIDTHAALCAELDELRIGLVHGRLKSDEKAAAMAAFAAGEIDVLVATTVIEVGVDVPNASLMVIEHAERFGLSQLHQLRGRVGRGVHDSVCVLLFARPLSETARARLKIIFENTDGFEIARQDLQLRGPGEFVGSRQSGVPLLRYADLELDADLVELARAMAEQLLRDDPACARRHLARWLGSREELLKA